MSHLFNGVIDLYQNFRIGIYNAIILFQIIKTISLIRIKYLSNIECNIINNINDSYYFINSK